MVMKNHEIYVVCDVCGEEYDARLSDCGCVKPRTKGCFAGKCVPQF